MLSIQQHLQRYEDLELQLLKVIEGDNEKLIYPLDDEISHCWDFILTLEPKDKSDRFALLEFFLNEVASNENGSIKSNQARICILRLVENRDEFSPSKYAAPKM